MLDEQPTVPTATWLKGLPKAEVHVHLEGCIELDTLRSAATDAGVDLGLDEGIPAFEGLGDFLEFLDRSCALLVRTDQIADVAYGFARRAAANGVSYSDAIFNPVHWPAWTDDLDGLLDALTTGFDAAEAEGLPPTGLCFSILRQQSGDEALDLARWIVASEHPRVVGISIDGNESAPGAGSSRFAPACTLVRDAGLGVAVHAGESSGADGVWRTLVDLNPDRIDHGVRSVDDPAVVEELARRGTPLGVCPSSNVQLHVVESLAAHPIERLRQAGVRVSLNTDDPILFGTRLLDEYERCVEAFEWSKDVCVAVARTSIEASFCSPELRRELLRMLDQYGAGTPDAR